MIARYPLGEYVASFDFFDWLVMVKAKGATEIVFDVSRIKTTKWPEHVVRERLRSILEPGPALAGLPYRFGGDGDPVVSPHMREIVTWVRGGGSFDRLRSVEAPERHRYTVTLRNDARIPARNSNDKAWRTFADEIGAFVIEDYDDHRMHLHDRMALYAGAKQNFGITCGPMHIISLTEFPMMMFANAATHGGYRNVGIEPGGNYPWCNDHQHIVWAEDDLESLRTAFREWQDRQ